MRGDFLANKEYIVSKYGDRITFLQIQPDYEMFELYLPRKIVDICLQENNLFILSVEAIHIYSLKTRILTENAVTLNSRPVSMEVSPEAMAILDTNNDIMVYSLSGERNIKNEKFSSNKSITTEIHTEPKTPICSPLQAVSASPLTLSPILYTTLYLMHNWIQKQ